jgi:hypothetical protein
MKVMFTALVLAGMGLLAGCGKEASTQVEGRTGAKLSLKEPGNVSVRRGDFAKVKIAIGREGFAAPVRIRFEGLPEGVEIVETDTRIVGDDGEFTVRAGRNATLVENQVAQVTAEGPGDTAVTQNFKVTVKEAETAGNR